MRNVGKISKAQQIGRVMPSDSEKRRTEKELEIMADKNKSYDQNRREAMYWAEEWSLKQRRKKIYIALAAVAAAIVVGFAIYYLSILGSRTVFHSEEEMRAAIQGRYTTDYFEDFYFEGDDVTLTYYNMSHYDRDYAERYGYDEYDDSVYEDKVEKWDYRTGTIKFHWMNDVYVDKNGNLVYYSQVFKKTDEPAPEPIDPSTLSNHHPEGEEEALPEEDEDAQAADGSEDDSNDGDLGAAQEQQENLEETQGAAEEAGVIPESEDQPDAT